VRESLRTLGLVVRTSLRVDPWRSIGSFLSEGLGGLAYPLIGLWVKLIVDGAVRGELGLALTGALGLAVLNGGGLMLLQGLGTRMRLTLMERVGFEFQRQLSQITATLPGLEHHERPEYLDKLQLLREAQQFLGGAANSIAVGLMNLIRFGGTLVLLAVLHPVLLLLPVFALPLALIQGRHQRVMRRVEEETAPYARLGQHLFGLGLEAGAAKEIRTSGLRSELLRRHRETVRRSIDPRIRATWRLSALSSVGWGVFASGFVAAIAFVTWRASQGLATEGDVIMALMVSQQVSGHVSGLVFTLTWLQQALRNAARLVWLIDYSKGVTAPGTEVGAARPDDGVGV
jgi:ATP-binding cassette, subfamily B, bacterial